MDFAAVVHRSQDTFCYPLDQERCLITLRTGKEVKQAVLNWEDPMESEYEHPVWIWHGEDKEADDVVECTNYLLWKFVVKPPFKRLGYLFKIFDGEQWFCFLENGFFKPEDEIFSGGRFMFFSFPWMNESDLIQTPQWVGDTRWYQIFPERFRKGNDTLSKGELKEWQSGPVTNEEHYGGDLKGITEKLPYIRDLGFNGLYLTPIFEAESTHKYDTKDYRKIDPAFGTLEDFKELTEKAHQLGIRVMLDGVFNHSGVLFAPWQDVLKKGPESEFFDWFMINQWPFDWSVPSTRDGKYYSFSFAWQMPKLNTNNPAVVEYFTEVCEYWMEQGVDGLRLDVAHEVAHSFLKKLRIRLKQKNPQFYILGEIWQDSIKWLRGDELDAVMNYPFRFTVMRFWDKKEMTNQEFARAIQECSNLYPLQVSRCAFNLLDSHDTQRLYSMHQDLDIFYQQLLLLYTMPGCTCSFYGTEIAMEGENDPDCRRCMPWERIETGEFQETIESFRRIVKFREKEPLTRADGIRFLVQENLPKRVLCYQRFHQFDGTEDASVLEVWINASDQSISLPEGKRVLTRKTDETKLYPGGFCAIRREEKKER